MPDSTSRGHNRGSPAAYPDGNGGHSPMCAAHLRDSAESTAQ